MKKRNCGYSENLNRQNKYEHKNYSKVIKSCGYSNYLKKKKNINPISTLNFVKNSNNITISNILYSNYTNNLTNIDSIYNPPVFKSLVTIINTTTYGVVNFVFPNQNTVQIVAVDGNILTENQYYDPDYVINAFNSGLLPIIQFTGTMTTTDKYNFDAYTGSIWFILYLYEHFQRVGILNTSSVILSVVNVNFTNAFWNGYYMTYGNSSDEVGINPITTLDIVGHEMMHGITDITNGLVYYGESGAINESISDIIGTVLELFYDIKSGKNLFDWTIGENAFPTALRSFANPNLFYQPDTYLGTMWQNTNIPYDNGGVHTNSGVSNYLFYLMCVPTQSTNDYGFSFQTITVFNILTLAKILYYSITGYTSYSKLSALSNYKMYVNNLLSNIKLYVSLHNLDLELVTTCETSIKAINLTIEDGVAKPKPKSKRRRKQYFPKKKPKKKLINLIY